MKILLLNPLIDAEHNVARALQKRGVALLLPADGREAWQMLLLHGGSLDIAVVNREGLGKDKVEEGLDFIKKVKSKPEYSELSIILTTSMWTDAQCAEHQESPTGVNAYLHSPFTEEQLIEMIEAVLVRPVAGPQTKSQGIAPYKGPDVNFDTGPVLQELDQVLKVNVSSDKSIQFELPVSAAPPKVPPAQPKGIPEEASKILVLDETPLEIPQDELDEIPKAPLPNSEPLRPSEGEGLEISMTGPSLVLAAPGESSEIQIPPALEVGPHIGPNMGGDIRVESGPELGGDGPQELDLPTGLSGQLSEKTPPPQLMEGLSLTPPPPAGVPFEGGEDQEAAQEMPYLFEESPAKDQKPHFDPARLFAEPIGDAVVPGGAAQAPDMETFKKYLLLREQDVAVLSTQLKAAQDQVAMVEQFLKEERAKNVELTHIVNEQKTKIDGFEAEKNNLMESFQKDMENLRFQVKAKSDKARLMEVQAHDTSEEIERLKERVRTDIRKIRVREKELENKLEIVKKDSEVLINSRENKIIELKRKLDLMEFNMDLLQDQFMKEKETSGRLKERLTKVAQVVRVAGGLLENQKAVEINSLLAEEELADKDKTAIRDKAS